MIKIIKSGKWAQKNPADKQLDIVEEMNIDDIPVGELLLLVDAGWAEDDTTDEENSADVTDGEQADAFSPAIYEIPKYNTLKKEELRTILYLINTEYAEGENRSVLYGKLKEKWDGLEESIKGEVLKLSNG